VRAGLLLLLSVLASQPCPAAGDGAQVTGSLNGYFLTPDGTLGVHEFALDARSPDGLPLHPLWSTYYLTLSIVSPRPLARVRVAAPDGAALYDHRYEPPVAEVRIPPEGAGALGAHSKHGLAWRVELEERGGETRVVSVQPSGVRWLPMPPLTVDWLELARIAEVRRLLRECGDLILPGLRADDVPFIVMGDDGCAVLVDYPSPPRGAVPYNGPSPLKAQLSVVRSKLDLPKGLEFGAAVMPVAGEPAVVLPYREDWYALPDTGQRARSGWEAACRLGTIVHEVCHVVWQRRVRKADVNLDAQALLQIPGYEARSLVMAENGALAEALTAAPGERARLAREFLALREERAAVDGAARLLLPATRLQETSEGFAYYAEWHLAQAVAQAGCVASLAADPFFRGPREHDRPAYTAGQLRSLGFPLGWMSAIGVVQSSGPLGEGQTLLLELLSPGAVRRAWEAMESPAEALARECGYSGLSDEARTQLRAQARAARSCDEIAELIRGEAARRGLKLRRALREAKPGGAVALYATAQLYGTVKQRVPTAERGEWQYLEQFATHAGATQVLVNRPCLVRVSTDSRQGTVDVRTLLGGANDIVHLARDGGLRMLGTKEVIFGGRCTPLRSRGGTLRTAPVVGRGNESRDGPTEEADQVMRRSMAVPLLFVLAAGPAAAQFMEYQTVTSTMSGLFLRTDTCVSEQKTFDLLNLPAEDTWQTIPGETYALSTTFADSLQASITQVTVTAPDDTLVADETASPPVSSLTAQGYWPAPLQFPSFTMSLGKLETKLKFVVTLSDDGSPEIKLELTVETKDVPADAPATITVIVVGPEGPLPYTNCVQLWRVDGQTETSLGCLATNGEGKVTFGQLSPGDYRVEVDVAASCHLKNTHVISMKAGQNLEYPLKVSPHLGIVGTIEFVDANGNPASGQGSAVTIELRQGQVTHMSVTGSGSGSTCSYCIGPAPPAGSFTVRGTYNGQTVEGSVVVNDDCQAWCANNKTIAPYPGSGGTHSAKDGPLLQFTVPGMP